jgi:hypothetical protein
MQARGDRVRVSSPRRRLAASLLALACASTALPSAAVSFRRETIAARQHYFGLDNVNPRTGEIRRDRAILSWTGVSGFAAAFRGKVVRTGRGDAVAGQPVPDLAVDHLIKKDLEAFVASLPDGERPRMRFMADPSDYLKPIVFDPDASVWK